MSYGQTRTANQTFAGRQDVLEASYCDLILSEVAEQRGALALGAGAELLKGASRFAGRVNRGVFGFGKRAVGATKSLRGDAHMMNTVNKMRSTVGRAKMPSASAAKAMMDHVRPYGGSASAHAQLRGDRRVKQIGMHMKRILGRGAARVGMVGAGTAAVGYAATSKRKHEELSFSEQLELGLSDLGRSAAGALHSAMPKVKSFFHRAMNAGRGAMNSMRSKFTSPMAGGRAPKIAGHLTGPTNRPQVMQARRPVGGGMRPRLGHAAAFGAGAVAGGMTMRKPSQADPYNQRSRTQ